MSDTLDHSPPIPAHQAPTGSRPKRTAQTSRTLASEMYRLAAGTKDRGAALVAFRAVLRSDEADALVAAITALHDAGTIAPAVFDAAETVARLDLGIPSAGSARAKK